MVGDFSSCCFFFSSRRRHTRFKCDWSSDVCSSDLCRRIRRLHLGGIHPIHFEWARSVDLNNSLAFAHRVVPHFLWHHHEVSDIHGHHFCFVERLAHACQECSL